jgi:hypothetical protein
LLTFSSSQVKKRLSDGWRSRFGFTAISVVNAFFESEEVASLFATDDSRQQFAKTMLKDFKFLYSDTKSSNPKASLTLQILAGSINLKDFLEVEGCLSGPARRSNVYCSLHRYCRGSRDQGLWRSKRGRTIAVWRSLPISSGGNYRIPSRVSKSMATDCQTRSKGL